MGTKETDRRRGPENDGLGSPPATKEIDLEFFHLDMAVQRSRRYHEKMAAFYARWRDAFRILTALAGSGAFVLVVADAKIFEEFATAFVALWAVLDIIIAPDKKSELHAGLRRSFTDLAAEIARSSRTPEELGRLAAARLDIEKGEPPVRRLVDLEARNDEMRARGYPPDDLVPLSKWQRRLGRYFDFGMVRLEQWKAGRQRQAPES